MIECLQSLFAGEGVCILIPKTLFGRHWNGFGPRIHEWVTCTLTVSWFVPPIPHRTGYRWANLNSLRSPASMQGRRLWLWSILFPLRILPLLSTSSVQLLVDFFHERFHSIPSRETTYNSSSVQNCLSLVSIPSWSRMLVAPWLCLQARLLRHEHEVDSTIITGSSLSLIWNSQSRVLCE